MALPSLPSLGLGGASQARRLAPPPLEPDESLLRRLGYKTLSGVARVGNLLDLPGSMVRDILAGENPLDQLLSPTTHENRTTGRDLMRRYGLVGGEDTWGNFLGGLAGEIALDPLTYTGLSGLTAAGRKAAETGILKPATKAAVGTTARGGIKRLGSLRSIFGDMGTIGPRTARANMTLREAAEQADSLRLPEPQYVADLPDLPTVVGREVDDEALQGMLREAADSQLVTPSKGLKKWMDENQMVDPLERDALTDHVEMVWQGRRRAADEHNRLIQGAEYKATATSPDPRSDLAKWRAKVQKIVKEGGDWESRGADGQRLLKGFDEMANDLGVTEDQLWEALVAGRRKAPMKHDADIVDEAYGNMTSELGRIKERPPEYGPAPGEIPMRDQVELRPQLGPARPLPQVSLQGPTALERLRQAAGSEQELQRLLDMKLGGTLTWLPTGAVFTNRAANQALDIIGGSIKGTAPMRRMGALFNSSSQNAVTETGQRSAQVADEQARNMMARAQEEIAKTIDPISRLMGDSLDNSLAVSRYLEGVEGLPEHLAELREPLDRLDALMRSVRDLEDQLGVKSPILDDLSAGYFPRWRTFMGPDDVSRKRGGSVVGGDTTMPLDKRHAHQIGRQEGFRHVPGGTATLQRMSVDPEFSGIYHTNRAAMNAPWVKQGGAWRPAASEAEAQAAADMAGELTTRAEASATKVMSPEDVDAVNNAILEAARSGDMARHLVRGLLPEREFRTWGDASKFFDQLQEVGRVLSDEGNLSADELAAAMRAADEYQNLLPPHFEDYAENAEQAWRKKYSGFTEPAKPVVETTERVGKFRQELTAAARTPEEANAIFALFSARAAAAGTTLDSYLSKRVARVEMANAGNVAPDALLQKAAFHGSPHEFSKFSLEKIGTGEGSNAYGWGLYFTETESVARGYRDRLSKQRNILSEADLREYYTPGRVIESKGIINSSPSRVEAFDWNNGAWKVTVRDLATGRLRQHHATPSFEQFEHVVGRRPASGMLAEVNLRPDQKQYLMWDDAVDSQSDAVRSAFESLGVRNLSDENIAGLEQQLDLRQAAVESAASSAARDRASSRLRELTKSLRDSGYDISRTDEGYKIRAAAMTGADAYETLAKRLGGKKQASEALREKGVRGIQYLDGFSRPEGKGSYNYVIFDDADAEIVRTLMQAGKGQAKGATSFLDDGRAVIQAFEAADLSTLAHETGHVFRRDLAGADLKIAEDWAGAQGGVWSREAEEKFARGFEQYLRDGKAPTAGLARVFAKFKDWLSRIYRAISGSDIDVNISPEMRGVYDRLFVPKQQAAEAQNLLPSSAIIGRQDREIGAQLASRVEAMDQVIKEMRDAGEQYEPEMLNDLIDARAGELDTLRYAEEAEGADKELFKSIARLDPRHAAEGVPMFHQNPAQAALRRLQHGLRASSAASATHRLFADHVQLLADLPDGVPLLKALEDADLTGAQAGAATLRHVDDELLERVREVYGGSTVDDFDLLSLDDMELLRHLGDSGGLQGPVEGGLVVPKEIAADAARVMKSFQSPEAVSDILELYDQFTVLTKSALTSVWPGFHVRNLVSAMHQNFVGGAFDPRDTIAVAKFLYRGHKGGKLAEIEGIRSLPIFAGQNLTDAQATRAFAELAYAEGLAGHHGWMEDIIGDPASLALANRVPGAADPWASTKVAWQAGWQRANPLQQQGLMSDVDKFLPVAAGRDVGNLIEGSARIAPFLTLLKRGWSPHAAALKVKALQVDYSRLSTFERAVMKRAFPFYSFARGMLPWTLEELASRPGGRLGQTIRAIRTLPEATEREPGVLPEHLQNTTAIPIPSLRPEDDSYITGLGLMLEDPMQMVGGPRAVGLEVLSRMNPMLKGPLEWVTGQSFFQTTPFGGRPMEDLDPTIGRTLANTFGGQPRDYGVPSAFEHLMANSPASRLLTTARQLSDPRKTLVNKGMNLLTGVRQTNVSEAARDTIVREKASELMRMGGGREFVRTYVNEADKAKMSPAERMQMEELQQLINIMANRAKARKKKQS